VPKRVRAAVAARVFPVLSVDPHHARRDTESRRPVLDSLRISEQRSDRVPDVVEPIPLDAVAPSRLDAPVQGPALIKDAARGMALANDLPSNGVGYGDSRPCPPPSGQQRTREPRTLPC
jgi:hypothetical protein